MTSGPVYVGAIVVFLFVLGLFTVKGTTKWAILAVTALSIVLAWGRNLMPITELFMHYFPGYNKFRTVSMILYIAEITIPLLGFMAVKQVWDGELTKERFINGLKWSLGIVGGICIIFIALGGALLHFEAEMDIRYIEAGYPEQLFEALRSDRQALMRADAFRSLAFVILAGAALLGFYLKKLKPVHFIVALGVLVISDMWVINRRYLNSGNFEPMKKVEIPFTQSSADAQILADTTEYFRVFNLTVSPFNDASTSYFHKSIGGYHGAKMRRYQELIDHHLVKQNQAALNMLNTRYLITQGGDGPRAILNPGALGNAWFVQKARIVENADQEIEALTGLNPADEAIVDKRFAHLLPTNDFQSNDSSDYIKLTEYSPNRLVYKYRASKTRLAIFSEIYYAKGWQAYVAGEPVDHFRANYVLRSMVLPLGEDEVVFEFKPKFVRAGYAIDLLSSILIIVTVLGWVGFEQYKSLKNKN
jgi:hypothetical protein